MVYSPQFIPGFSASVDFWRIYLQDVITGINAQSVLNLCFAGVSIHCPLIDRLPAGSSGAGQILNVHTPTTNLGRIDVKGVDLASRYKLPAFWFGQFTLSLHATYMSQYKIQTVPGQSGNRALEGVGEFAKGGSPLASACPFGDCFIPRIRAQGEVDWQLGSWNAVWRLRYISSFKEGSPDPSQGFSAAPGFATDNPLVLHYGATVYSDVTLGYDIRPINTEVTVGANNLFDKKPPQLFPGTDSNDFNVIGRFYWARATVKF